MSVALGVAWSKQLGGWVTTWKNPPRRNLKLALWGVVLPRKITKLEPEEDKLEKALAF